MTPKVLVQVTLLNEEGDISKTIIRAYGGTYYWEIERMFDELGAQVATIVDPTGRG